LASQNLFATISDIMAQTITAVKQMITRLRPRLLDDLGLTAAIEWQIEEFQQRSGIACQVMIEPAEIILDPDRSTAVFRILQEALTNIARHAQARQVTVRLSRCDTTLELLVHDDGCGINATELNDPTSFGLIGMRERAEYFGGELDIQSQPQEGTSIRLSLRLPPGEIP
jgi:signal transduction histidine kinase